MPEMSLDLSYFETSILSRNNDREHTDWQDRQSGEDVAPEEVVFGGRLFDYEGNWSAKLWNDLQSYVHSRGYDAVRLSDLIDGERAPVVVALHEAAIKSAAPFCYDDAGDLIPLEHRFSKNTPDIRGDVLPHPSIGQHQLSTSCLVR